MHGKSSRKTLQKKKNIPILAVFLENNETGKSKTVCHKKTFEAFSSMVV